MIPPLKERLAKVIAGAGVCSRRSAEKLILEGRVMVNGQAASTPATLVINTDLITIDGVPLSQKPTPRVWAFYKPRGVITTHKDPQKRTTLFDLLPPTLPRVISIGRLDIMSEGLILLTNNGELARTFELPSNRIPRTYRVRIFGKINQDQIQKLLHGVTIDKIRYGSIQVKVSKQEGANQWLELTLHEGKNREIRKIISWLGYKVNRLIRMAYGPIHLGNLKPKELKEVTDEFLKIKF